MTNPFSQAQVRTFAVQAGWSTENARIIAAIAMVESAYSANGRSYADADKEGDQALANTTFGYSYGLTQVRSVRAQKGTDGPRDELRLKEPLFNLQSALAIYAAAGNSFKPWTTYNSGQYKAYLQDEFPPPIGVHIVTYGDTLTKIAEKYRLLGQVFTWQQLARANGLVYPYTIYIAQPLELPVFPYTVNAGDTLSRIAATYTHVTVAQIASFNMLPNPDVISVGQKLMLPHPVMFSL